MYLTPGGRSQNLKYGTMILCITLSPFTVLLPEDVHIYGNSQRTGLSQTPETEHGIVANPGNREWERFPLSLFVVCDNPVHGVMVN